VTLGVLERDDDAELLALSLGEKEMDRVRDKERGYEADAESELVNDMVLGTVSERLSVGGIDGENDLDKDGESDLLTVLDADAEMGIDFDMDIVTDFDRARLNESPERVEVNEPLKENDALTD